MIKKLLLIVVLFSPLNLSQTFHSLDGIEDQQGNTHLIYRLGSQGFHYSPVYKYDVNSGTETFIMEAYYNSYPGSQTAKAVLDFEFFPNQSENFMNVGYTIYPDNHSYIARNDTVVYGGMGGYYRVDISKQNPLKVFAFVGDAIRRSFDGGFTFPEDSILLLTDYEFFNLTEYDDNIFFGYDFENRFVKGGALVDTSKIFFDDYTKILYDVNQYHVYRVNKTYGGYAFYVSNNKGDAFTWTKTYHSENPLFITIDPLQSGIIYLSDGKKIYRSTNNGYTFTYFRSLANKIVGLYKKAGTETIFAATPYTIYKIVLGEISIIKNLPVSPELFDWFPITVGNKWIYKITELDENCFWPTDSYDEICRVTGDTIVNSHTYYKLEPPLAYNYNYVRIDSINGLLKSLSNIWGDTIELTIYNFRMEVGDTVCFDSSCQYGGFVLENEEIQFIFGQNRLIRNFSPLGFLPPAFSLVDGIGYYRDAFCEFGGSWRDLKGCEINREIYGDTTFVVGIDDDPDQIPSEFKLEQNYPNPFNPSTKIKFSIPLLETHRDASLLTTLKVYDVLGREVATLVNEYRDAGSYEVEFDGSQLASGVYYYQLKVGEFIETKKMIVIK